MQVHNCINSLKVISIKIFHDLRREQPLKLITKSTIMKIIHNNDSKATLQFSKNKLTII